MLTTQKASFWKRISAFLLDGILFGILAVGFAFLLNVIIGYDSHYDKLTQRQQYYEQQYGVNFEITAQELEALSPEEREVYNQVEELIANDDEFNSERDFITDAIFITVSLGIFLAAMVLEFILPLVFKNGQTVGKKVFGLCVMRTNAIRVDGVCMFIRAILGKFAIETMVPVLLIIMMILGSMNGMGLLVIFALGILQIVLMIATKNNCLIHDVMADTVVVDYASQMIFDNVDQMVEYKRQLAEQQAQNDKY